MHGRNILRVFNSLKWITRVSKEEGKSKSQIKREMAEIAKLAKELVHEKVIDLHDLPLEEEVIDAILLGRRCQKGALKRQIKHIASLLTNTDEVALRETMTRLKQPHVRQVEAEHKLENLRDRLMAEDSEVFAELMNHYTNFDRQHLHQLVRNAIKEKAAEKPPKYYRQIFQYLKTLEPENER